MKPRSQYAYVLTGTNHFIEPRLLQMKFKKIIRNCSIQDVNVHALRHTFATKAVVAGVDIKSLSQLIGHSDVNFTFQTYVHPSIEARRQQLEKVSQVYSW